MDSGWMIGFAFMFPLVCLGGVLFLGYLEETLVDDVKRTRKRPAPAPIRAVRTSATSARGLRGVTARAER